MGLKIERLLGRPISFQPILVPITGSVNSALFLSQAIYWTGKTTHDGKWFYKTIEEWEQETGLSNREIEGARNKLKNLGLLQERYERLKWRMWYRLNLGLLEKMLISECQEEENPHPTKPQMGNCGNSGSSSNIEYIGNTTTTENTYIDYRNQIEKDFADENEETLVNETPPESEVKPTSNVPGSLSFPSRPRSGSRWKKKGGREIELFGPLDYSASSKEMEEFQQVWNGVFVLQRIVSLKGREALVREAMKDEWWRNNYKEGIRKVAASKFCLGHNKLKWKATVEWFLRPATLARVLEGQYDGQNPPAQFNPEDFTRETI